ncbi:RNA polymerase sigma factor region1.1 domain-containing protein [Hansschlegelia beijingensis]
MDSNGLSPEMREILRRLVLRTRERGFVTFAELERAWGPRQMSATVVEHAVAYLNESGIRLEPE